MTSSTIPPRPMPDSEAAAPYEARDGKVFKRPIERRRDDGRTNVTLGFPVCVMTDWAGKDAAETVAALMNAGERVLNVPAPTEPEAAATTDAELCGALKKLAVWQPDDGDETVVLLAAARIEALTSANARLVDALRRARAHVAATNGAEHMMEGFGPRKAQPSDALLAEIDALLGGGK